MAFPPGSVPVIFVSPRLFLSRQPARDRSRSREQSFSAEIFTPLASPRLVDNKFTAVTLLIPRKIEFSLGLSFFNRSIAFSSVCRAQVGEM